MNIQNSLLVIATFLFAVYGRRFFLNFFEVSFESVPMTMAYNYGWLILPILVTTGFLFGFKSILSELGLNKDILRALVLSLIAVSPMMIGNAILGDLTSSLSLDSFFRKTVFAGLTEEILFRGFLFGLLFRRLGWGFIPAALIGAIIFGMVHVYQGNTFSEMMGVFAVTFLGSLWFSWLFIEWNENLWVPIFLHILMNLSWTIFNISDNALGNLYANIFRALTIAITVIATVRNAKKRGYFMINKGNLIAS